MGTRSSVIGGWALVAALVLSGCSASPGGGASAEPTRTATAKPSATATPSPSGDPSAEPTAAADAPAQTRAEACGIVNSALDSLGSVADPENLATLQGDPAAATAAFSGASATIRDAAAAVSNADVKPAVDSAAAAADAYFTALAGLVSDPESGDADQLSQGVLDYSQAESDLQQICAP